MTSEAKLLKKLYARKTARFNRYAEECQALRDKLEADLNELEKKLSFLIVVGLSSEWMMPMCQMMRMRMNLNL